jgi:hypothetical protein
MKDKEHQEDFNMKLIKILEKIEKKLDKESGSNKLGSHIIPRGKGISRSGSRHHHHFQKNSNRRVLSHLFAKEGCFPKNLASWRND